MLDYENGSYIFQVRFKKKLFLSCIVLIKSTKEFGLHD